MLAPTTVPMHTLYPGQTAEVRQLVGPTEQVRRLEEMGFRQGRVVEMVQRGSPCIVRMAGTKLCFRSTDALSVLVEPLETAGRP